MDGQGSADRLTSLRSAALAVLVLLVALLGWNEWHANTQRDLTAGPTVDADVDSAHRELKRRLVSLERSCAALADEALNRAGSEVDPGALFRTLESLDLPEEAGLHLFDRYGRMIAWTGASARDSLLRSMPTDRDCGVILSGASSRRLTVRRQRTSPIEGVAVVAIAHRPIDTEFPGRSRPFRSSSIEQDIEAAFSVGGVRIKAAGTDVGISLPSKFGGELARLVVEPLDSEVWTEIVDDRAALRRAVLVALLALLAAGLAVGAAREITRDRPVATWIVRAAAIVGLRLALTAAPLGLLLDGAPLVEATSYAGSLPLDLNASPLELLLTTIAAAGSAICLAVACHQSRRPLRLPTFAAAWIAAALVARLQLANLVDSLVWNSTVRFLSEDVVLPPSAALALLVALTAAGIAAVALLDGLWHVAAPDNLRTLRARIVGVVVATLLMAPLGPPETELRLGLTVAGLIGIGVALGASIVGRGAATRAAVIPLGLAFGLFAPLQHHLDRSLKADLEFLAEERLADDDGGREERALPFVERVLDDIAESPALRESLTLRRLPRDLASRLWKASALADRPVASGLSILPLRSEFRQQTSSSNLPPRSWLPDPSQFFAPTERWVAARNGRGLGADGRWVVGEIPIVVDDVPVISVRVWFEIRTPRTARLLAIDETDAGEVSSRTPPPPLMDHYDADGRLVVRSSENALTLLGSQLPDAVRRELAAGGGPVWRTVAAGANEFLVLVLPDETAADSSASNESEPGGALVFSTDAVGPRDLLLRTTRATLVGALLSALALVLSSPWWARRAALRLSHRLVLSYVLVSALPLLFLAWANRNIVQERDAAERLSSLREAVTVLARDVPQRGNIDALVSEDVDELERTDRGVVPLAEFSFSPGRRDSLYLGWRLYASTDLALLDTDLLPMRMPGRAFDQVVLQGRAFHVETVRAGGREVEVGYAPLRNPDPESPADEVIGAVSVAALQSSATQARDQANAVTTVLGFYLASLIAAMAFGTWMAARLTSPLRELRLATRRVAEGDLSEPVPGEGPDELGQVVEAFNTMTRDLADSREKLVKAEKEAAWRDMARQVAHEVKNPLTPMRLAAEHLRRAHQDKSPMFDRVLQRSVDVIVRQTENLRRIVTDFRDFARLPVQRREPCSLSPIVTEVLDLYHGVPGLTIVIDAPDDLPQISADPNEMRRVLVNLAGNAVEALDHREGTLSARVAHQDGHVVLTLVDDGPGIDPATMPRLFEPNFSTKTGGTGLGLAICKRAIDDLGGSIHIDSTPGEGATVTVRLPALPA
jgi:signal transduction histidine kinase